ncbi:MAG: 50S ribosomal protein L9 [Verrucomicrobiae bacterium]|nr:50S ribosomal protein L9 [Verrucomicrobiae bacterium]
MGKLIDVILTSNIIGLGAESDQVKVAAGYARNYLFPRGLAIPLTAANKRRLEVLRQRRAEREAQELNTMLELAKSLQKLVCIIKVKTGEDGKMFGAVTSGMIADELKNQFDIALDKRKIHLEQPIRALGEYEVELHLHPEVKGKLKLRVESETPLPESVLQALAAAQPAQGQAGAAPDQTAAAKPGDEKTASKKQPAEKGKKQPAAQPEKPAKEPEQAKAGKPAKAAKQSKQTQTKDTKADSQGA